MSALASTPKKSPRRAKAANTVDKALRGGILAGAVAAVGWLLAAALGGTALFIMVIATVLAAIYMVAMGNKARLGIWVSSRSAGRWSSSSARWSTTTAACGSARRRGSGSCSARAGPASPSAG